MQNLTQNDFREMMILSHKRIDVEVSFSNLIPPSVGSVMGSKTIIASWAGI